MLLNLHEIQSKGSILGTWLLNGDAVWTDVKGLSKCRL